MATKYHGQLTDADGIHEPKGITTAPADAVYVADGSGSGSWKASGNVVNTTFGSLYLTTSPSSFTVATVGTRYDFPVGMTLDTPSGNFSYNDTTKELTYTGTKDIVILLSCSISIALVGAGTPTLTFAIQKNNVDINGAFVKRKFGGNDVGVLSMHALTTLSNGDKIKITYESDVVEAFNIYSTSITAIGLITANGV